MLLQALLQGLTYNSFSNFIHIFLPDASLSLALFNTSKHAHLSLSHSIINQFSHFLSSHELHHIDLHRYSIKWAGLPGKAIFEELTSAAQSIILPIPPTPLLHPKDRLLCDLQDEYICTTVDSLLTHTHPSQILAMGYGGVWVFGIVLKIDKKY